MGITTRSQDKYAFLFSGPTAIGRFIKDLEEIFQTLTEHYNYPPGNVTVVLGSADAVPSVPGATVSTVSTAGQLQVALDNFATAAFGPAAGLAPPDNKTTALLYFTGFGVRESGVSKLVIDGGDGSNNVDPAWLTARLNGFSDCHVQVLMQQSYAGGFLSALTGCTLTQWSLTHACGAAEESFGNNSLGSFFTHGWARGLRLEALPAGTPDAGKYADELLSSDRQVSLQEAQVFAKQIHDLLGYGPFSTPGYNDGGGSQFLGLPDLLIRDGTPWYESPDIFLTHPNHPSQPPGDLYIPDPPGATSPYNNTINVVTRNVGTHPLRAYSLAVELFKFGGGGPSQQDSACDIAPSAGLLLPIDASDIGTPADRSDTYEWNTPFWAGSTHQCVKAEAEVECADLDFTWSVQANDNEAQRNIDEVPVAPPGPTPLPFPGLQGTKRHRIYVLNRFRGPRRFVIAFPVNLDEHKEVLGLQWFRMLRGKWSQLVPLDPIAEPMPGVPLDLAEGEEAEVVLEVGLKEGVELGKRVRLAFDILVAGDFADARALARAAALPAFAPIGGFTAAITAQAATLKGTVLKDGKPVAHAKVLLRTVNDLAGAAVITNEAGGFALEGINPDIYRVRAETTGWRSLEQMLILYGEQAEQALDLELTEQHAPAGVPVKVILDRIRIMNDHDPCIKGKGELTFSSVVVPDNDASRKQVTRLPATGVYRVSGKPGENDIALGVTLFEGVVSNRALAITLSGKEIDLFDPDDVLNRYHRVFSGDPEEWYGAYHPSDEYLDREDVGDWALWYRIVPG